MSCSEYLYFMDGISLLGWIESTTIIRDDSTVPELYLLGPVLETILHIKGYVNGVAPEMIYICIVRSATRCRRIFWA
jgi:hypothetical protein